MGTGDRQRQRGTLNTPQCSFQPGVAETTLRSRPLPGAGQNPRPRASFENPSRPSSHLAPLTPSLARGLIAGAGGDDSSVSSEEGRGRRRCCQAGFDDNDEGDGQRPPGRELLWAGGSPPGENGFRSAAFSHVLPKQHIVQGRCWALAKRALAKTLARARASKTHLAPLPTSPLLRPLWPAGLLPGRAETTVLSARKRVADGDGAVRRVLTITTREMDNARPAASCSGRVVRHRGKTASAVQLSATCCRNNTSFKAAAGRWPNARWPKPSPARELRKPISPLFPPRPSYALSGPRAYCRGGRRRQFCQLGRGSRTATVLSGGF